MNYFLEHEAEQYSFIRIPKQLVESEVFSTLSMDAKMLYGLMLDRMSLSAKNQWIDEAGRVYILYPVELIMGELNISKKKAVTILGELEEIGLVEKAHQTTGLPNRLYVKNFI